MIRRFDRLVSFASAVVDVTTYIPHLPERGGDVLSTGSLVALGGAFNAESAAHRLGLPTEHHGSMGTGRNSQLMAEALALEGIPFLGKTFDDADLGFCVTMVEPDGQRTFVTTIGAEARLDLEHLSKVKLGPTDALYISGYDLVYPDAHLALTEWLKGDHLNGAALFFDPAALVADINPEALEIIRREGFLIACNEYEFDYIKPRASDRALFARRIGPGGCELYESGELKLTVPVEPVKAIDSTGAGDVHMGAMIAFVAQGYSWKDAIGFANRAAAFSVQVRGGASGPTLAQLGL